MKKGLWEWVGTVCGWGLGILIAVETTIRVSDLASARLVVLGMDPFYAGLLALVPAFGAVMVVHQIVIAVRAFLDRN